MIEWNYFHGTNQYRFILDKGTIVHIDNRLDLVCAKAWMDMNRYISHRFIIWDKSPRKQGR